MNLRDKLRASGSEPEDTHPPAWESDSAVSQPAQAAPSPRAALPQLDVNRRFLLLAAAAAFLAATVGVTYLNKSAAGLSEAGEKVEVVVLTEDVERGSRLSDDRLTTAAIPRAFLPKGAIEAGAEQQGLEKAKGMVALAPMVAGEPLIEARVSPPDRKLGIAYLLRRGERAKTINVDSASGLAGLIKPGNEVDLIATIPDPNNDMRRIGTPVLQKARVIAVGDHLLGEVRNAEEEAKDESGGIASDSTVTLAILANKVGLVTLLEDLGNLKVVLRADGDTSLQKTQFSDEAIMALVSGRVPGRPVVRSAPAVQAPNRPRVVIREVVRPAEPPRPRPQRVAPPAPVRPAAQTQTAPAPKKPTTPHVIRFGGGE
ncbi:MAG: Flp pilus assembly protein CpaB [Candidatus Sericytochromatia bacterium]|nr:Flp pilus assembly protein CpaB [Candidatus Sericytochromatia bacterium]